MTEDTTHVRMYESDKDRLRLTFKGRDPATLTQLIDARWKDSQHDPVVKERENRPAGPYVMCEDCGRNKNTLAELDERPCKDKISVKE